MFWRGNCAREVRYAEVLPPHYGSVLLAGGVVRGTVGRECHVDQPLLPPARQPASAESCTVIHGAKEVYQWY